MSGSRLRCIFQHVPPHPHPPRPLLRGRRLLRRPLGAGGPRRHHPRPRRSRDLGVPRLSDILSRAWECCARGWSRVPRSAASSTARRSALNGTTVSLHPAGHILGSSQVRIEHGGEVWVVSGDYKTDPDPTCTPFEPVRCHTFVTESTFGLPIYRWPSAGGGLRRDQRLVASQRRGRQDQPAPRLRARKGAAAARGAGSHDRADPDPWRGRADDRGLSRRRDRLPPTRYAGAARKSGRFDRGHRHRPALRRCLDLGTPVRRALAPVSPRAG